ncbi:hypothetical protein [Saccharothrix sp.]|uniref:hypothetical protein n=1 Tax=Saccharothrix sp. TaxID=1873460 RepID=UPI002811E03C|nr:hypothetical protein [Saccharothrix sp.]
MTTWYATKTGVLMPAGLLDGEFAEPMPWNPIAPTLKDGLLLNLLPQARPTATRRCGSGTAPQLGVQVRRSVGWTS